MRNDLISKSALIKDIEDNKNIVRDSMNSRVHAAYKMAHEDIIRIIEGKEVVRKPSELEKLENRIKNLKRNMATMITLGYDSFIVKSDFLLEAMEYCEKLRDYMTLEYQEFLVNIKCRPGDIIYGLLLIPSNGRYIFSPLEVKEISIGTYCDRKNIQYKVESVAERGRLYKYYLDEYGTNWFTSEAEAEEATLNKNGGTR